MGSLANYRFKNRARFEANPRRRSEQNPVLEELDGLETSKLLGNREQFAPRSSIPHRVPHLARIPVKIRISTSAGGSKAALFSLFQRGAPGTTRFRRVPGGIMSPGRRRLMVPRVGRSIEDGYRA